MPELPEVETVRRYLEARLKGRRVEGVEVRERRLRLPVEGEGEAVGRRLLRVGRRGKYLLLDLGAGALIVHLGMSGHLRWLPAPPPPGPHDHLDLLFEGGRLRLRDPRRFGLFLWSAEPLGHPLLCGLGPEPLGEGFSGEHLHRRAQGRRIAVKHLIMDGRVVAGIGNIYASEALFRAGIHPARAAGDIPLPRYRRLAGAIREVLSEAIEAGGTTLRDFRDGEGRPGYFAQRLLVYGRAGEPCPQCGGPIQRIRLGQRSTYLCPRCQG